MKKACRKGTVQLSSRPRAGRDRDQVSAPGPSRVRAQRGVGRQWSLLQSQAGVLGCQRLGGGRVRYLDFVSSAVPAVPLCLLCAWCPHPTGPKSQAGSQGLCQQHPFSGRTAFCPQGSFVGVGGLLPTKSPDSAERGTPGSHVGRTQVQPEPEGPQSSCQHHGGRPGLGRSEEQESPEEPGPGGGRWDTVASREGSQGAGSLASGSFSLWGGLLRSSNVSSTTCQRQLSSGNSLSTRLTRK